MIGKLAVALVATASAMAAPPALASPSSRPAAAASADHHPSHATLTLTNADNGRHIRVHRGQRISVVLTVDPQQYPDPTTWWSSIAATGTALRVLPQTAMPVRGATLGRFKAIARGSATLSSTRSVCPPPGTGPPCHLIQAWQVTVNVR